MAGTDLTGADLSDGDFHRTVFANAKLMGANLENALLPRSDFRGATLTNALLAGAYLYRAEFSGVDLTVTKGLVQSQIDQACGDQATKLPAGLSAPPHWPCHAE
jgi:uncharacterized protein YjbI with pentapeptide repeats